jgi:hypothetical protein
MCKYENSILGNAVVKVEFVFPSAFRGMFRVYGRILECIRRAEVNE